MAGPTAAWTFRALRAPDLARLHEWLARPHVARWWKSEGTLEGTRREFAELLASDSATRGYIALYDGQPAGFAQCYRVMGAGGGWWESETDPGARGIDLFIADPALLGRGLGAALIAAFAEEIFRDPAVTRIQADPAPDNARAIGAYRRAGFGEGGSVTTPDGAALLLVRTRA
jgi:RimJ/RimL family protein N-acetyltransferase